MRARGAGRESLFLAREGVVSAAEIQGRRGVGMRDSTRFSPRFRRRAGRIWGTVVPCRARGAGAVGGSAEAVWGVGKGD